MRRQFLFSLAVIVACTAPGRAQDATAQLPRGDVQSAVGWQNLRGNHSTYGNDWMNAIGAIDGAFGWYWTEHLRTQVDASTGSAGRQYNVEPLTINGNQAYVSSRTIVRPSSVGLTLQYQFFHNAVFHPHIGAGVLLRNERVTEEYESISYFDPVRRESVFVQQRHTEGPENRRRAVPVVDFGYKAYLSQRAFFVNDMRLSLRGGVEGVLFRFGFGIDLGR
jgi:hypothetical protein